MHEPWLRTSEGCCLQAPQNHDVYNIKVQQLLLPNIKKWDEDKIISLFPLEVAHDILAVPLLEVVKEDKLIWKGEKDGRYSVRSGYRNYMKHRNRGCGASKEEGWSSIWKIHAPPKAKHLLWRVCRDCLPTRIRLRNRYVDCQEECPLCLSCGEEEQHLFFNCDGVREAWHVMGLSHIIQSRLHMFTNVRDIIFDICRQESNMVAGKFATLLWFVWHNGNNKVWNDSSLQAQQIGAQAAKHWHDWAAVHDLQIDAQQPVHTATAGYNNAMAAASPRLFKM
jgi:hypothetical protein